MKNTLVTLLAVTLAILGAERLNAQIVLELSTPSPMDTVTVGDQFDVVASISSLSGAEVLTAYNLPIDIGGDGFGLPAGIEIMSIDSMNGDFSNFNSSLPPGAPFNFDLTASDSDATGAGLSVTPVDLFSVTLKIAPTFPITQFDVDFQDSPTPNEGLFAVTLDGQTFNEVDLVMNLQVSTRPLLLGDVNLDGVVNLLDVDAFVALLGNGYQIEADIDGNGVFNLLDVDGFIAILNGG